MAKHDNTKTIARAAAPLVALLGCIGAAHPAFAQSAPGVTVDVGDCVKLQTPEERLACFDSAVKKSGAAPAAAPPPAPSVPPAAQPSAAAAPAAAPAAVPPAPAAVAPQAAASSAAPAAAAPSASSSAAPATGAGHERQETEAAAPSTIVAKIKSLRPTVPNAYQITLDNGQVWRQTYPQFYPLQPGNEVTLTATRWGDAYRLSSEHLKGFIQVERVH